MPERSLAAPARWLRRLVAVEPVELVALLWSFVYFFLLLCSYYILRPLRDEMGIAGGVQQLPWVFTGTFVAMLAAVPAFGWCAARFTRRQLLPAVYYFFAANLLLFYALFQLDDYVALTARAFFIWVSVFNLFVVSVFWSFMVDLYTNAQARRLFGFIAAGGSAGAVTGPLLTASLVKSLGPVNLLPVSCALLLMAVFCIHRLVRWARTIPPAESQTTEAERPLGGSMWAGFGLVARTPYLLGIGLFIWLFTTLSTFLYFEQAHIVSATYADPADRTRLFALIDLGVNVLTIAVQVVLTGRLLKWLGIPLTLALVPLLSAIGFIALGAAPVLPVLVAFQIARRAGDYAVMRPAREVLFTVVGRETKYKAKNFIDTVVYRGGDAISGWAFAGLKALGLGLTGIAVLSVPLALAWAWLGIRLGRRQEELRGSVIRTGGEP
ncbi:MAG: MFS transporter [Gammaproteobacteria bacterium]|nr:MAG: MFS transporter [Gammaproteobacteria bacterium]